MSCRLLSAYPTLCCDAVDKISADEASRVYLRQLILVRTRDSVSRICMMQRRATHCNILVKLKLDSDYSSVTLLVGSLSILPK